MIHLEKLSYTYPGRELPALSDITLDIEEGQFVLVAGPSGGGKSTLLRCFNGLVPHFSGGKISGRITVGGYDPVVDGPQKLSRVVGFVFQDPEAQFVLDQVEDEIAFALENAAIHPSEMRVRVENVLRLLDLSHLRERPLTTLSGGEKQRVAVAAALALQPSILVLDEPTSQLDPQSAEEVLQALVRLNQELGLTIILAEHRLERVLPYVDIMLYMAPGLGILSGKPRSVLLQVPLTPPLITLGSALGWSPQPLTIEEALPLAQKVQIQDRRKDPDPVKRQPLLQIQDLNYAYKGNTALREITFTIGSGELVALMGRNGSGKTTLLKCIVGLLRPRQGQIMLAKQSLIGMDVAEICRQVGYLPQTPDDLLFADTVGEELEVTLRNHDLLDHPPVQPAVLLDRLDLAQLVGRYPRDLSVGQRQRVSLGVIAITRPQVLLLDEPTRGLDYQAKQTLVSLLHDWQTEGTAILLATHDVELVAQIAERIVFLDDGEIIADNTPELLSSTSYFSPQMARLFPGQGLLTPEDVLFRK